MRTVASSSRVEIPSPADDRTSADADWIFNNEIDTTTLDKSCWCPNTVAQIRRRFSPSTANLLFQLPRKEPPLRGHSECNEKSCVAHKTDRKKEYQSTHWDKHCPPESRSECKSFGPTVDDVERIVDKGGIPLISLRQSMSGDPIIKVVRAKQSSKYFAVSHVWSGGLGNPTENKLNPCQLKRLFDLGMEFKTEERIVRIRASKFKFFTAIVAWAERKRDERNPPECLFWMDTLCIPIVPRLKKRAINTMAQIYVKSQGIVILDDELRQLPFDHVARQSMVFGYLFCSAWMSRCWTFQEGAMAKFWFVQFEDKLHSIDSTCSDIERYIDEFSKSHRQWDRSIASFWANEFKQFYSYLPRRPLNGSSQSFAVQRPGPRSWLFRHTWNHIVSRSTTERADLITILTIMLEYRPKDLSDCLEDDLLSIFVSQTALPISFLYRERDKVTSWQQSKRWLPSAIEECEIDVISADMWRRATDENFFVFNRSLTWSKDPPSSIPKFYFSDSKVPTTTELILEDNLDDSQENKLIVAELMLSSDLQRDLQRELPELKLCVVLSGREASPHTIRHGACLGVRKEENKFIQMYYICPVECKDVDIYSPDFQTESCSASRLFRQPVVEGFDYVLEHGKWTNSALHFPHADFCCLDFSGASTPLPVRPSFSEGQQARAFATIFLWPFSVLFVTKVFTWAFVIRYVALPLYDSVFMNVFALIFEFLLESLQVQSAEFHEWYSDLYDDKVAADSIDFYIHFRGWITCCILGLGSLSWAAIFSRKKALAEDIPYLYPIFIIWAIESVGLFTRWLLELYAHAPASVNLPRWLAQSLEKRDPKKVKWYFERFYDKSYLTKKVESIISKLSQIVKGCAERLYAGYSHLKSQLERVVKKVSQLIRGTNQHSPNSQDSNSSGFDLISPSPNDNPADPSLQNSGTSDPPPWEELSPPIYSPSRFNCKLSFLGCNDTILTATVDEPSGGFLSDDDLNHIQVKEYPPFRYLGAVVFRAYLTLFGYWLIPELILAGMRDSARQRNEIPAANAYILMSRWLALVMIASIIEGIVFVNRPYHPAKVDFWSWRRLVHSNMDHISVMRTSLHFPPRTTMIILVICCPLTLLNFLRPQLNLFGGLCVLAAAVLGNLAMRWVIELWALVLRRVPHWLVNFGYTFDGVVGKGNKELDECFGRVYHQSRLTKWLVSLFLLPRNLWIKRRQSFPWARGGLNRSLVEQDVEVGDDVGLLANEGESSYVDSDDL
jgi:hypothetical protein